MWQAVAVIRQLARHRALVFGAVRYDSGGSDAHVRNEGRRKVLEAQLAIMKQR